ncbi:hypothetical protein ACFVS2_21100 [Brevibacillus sp. NPDC058079]|uniref:hypothetical protein n=1 Tax=Brevibacillus sp. NPDC058079 TaxID=3346330 RepID=UPI0036EF5CF0
MNTKRIMSVFVLTAMLTTGIASIQTTTAHANSTNNTTTSTHAYSINQMNANYPKGVFEYTPTADEEAKFGFRYAFVDKDGDLRKFVTKEHADMLYKIYGQNTEVDKPTGGDGSYPKGVFAYTPTAEEEAKFGFRYAFVDKDGDLRKFVTKENAEMLYKIYGQVTDSEKPTNGNTTYPKGVFAYKPTAEEDAKFGFRYAFVDKDGDLRKFVTKENADMLYKIYGQNTEVDKPTGGKGSYPKGVFAYTPTAEEEAKFGFRYAFVDKDGDLRKFALKEHADMLYKVYGPTSDVDKDTSPNKNYPKGVFAYTPTPEEDAKFGFRYAFVDKDGGLRKFALKEHADMLYKVYGPNSDVDNVKSPNTNYPKGVFAYTPTPEEDAKFGFRYAFVDKDGGLRKFALKEHADMLYKVYGSSADIDNGNSTDTTYPKGVFAYTPTPEEEAKFGFRYAFVDKDGDLRKFVKKEHADMLYKIYGKNYVKI